MTKIEYWYLPLNTLKAYKLSEEHLLTENDAAKLVVNSKLIKRFIEQYWISLQFDIGMGLCENIEVELQVVKRLAEIAKEIWDIKTTFDKYKSKEE